MRCCRVRSSPQITACMKRRSPFAQTDHIPWSRRPICRGTDHQEIGGDVAGIWSLANSPYYIVGNAHVPEGQTLTIDLASAWSSPAPRISPSVERLRRMA